MLLSNKDTEQLKEEQCGDEQVLIYRAATLYMPPSKRLKESKIKVNVSQLFCQSMSRVLNGPINWGQNILV